jgi:cytochrome c biogenesis factor
MNTEQKGLTDEQVREAAGVTDANGTVRIRVSTLTKEKLNDLISHSMKSVHTAGKYYGIITGKGDYAMLIKGLDNKPGSRIYSKAFFVKGKKITSAMISISENMVRYTEGMSVKPLATVYDRAIYLKESTSVSVNDFKVTLRKKREKTDSETMTSVGKYTLTIEGQGNYRGKIKKTITVYDGAKTLLSEASISVNMIPADGSDRYVYNKKNIKPIITITENGEVLNPKKDYKVVYKNNRKRGIARVIIKGKRGYRGELSRTFVIE